MSIKVMKTVMICIALVAALFLFTRPADYRNLLRDLSGTLEDQWCAWSELVGYQCDRWRHARRIIDEARSFGERIKSQLPEGTPVEDVSGRKE